MPEKWAIFDLDGTLFNTEARFKECLYEVGAKSLDELRGEKRREFWECFLSDRYMFLDWPNDEVVRTLLRLKSEGIKIMILTGRREDTQRKATLIQLKAYGIPYDKLVMRKPNDYRKDHEFKIEEIKKLLESGVEIVGVWDDSRRVIEAVKGLIKDDDRLVLVSSR